MSQGIVYLVGAGPGDPGLLTLRGAECLQMAQVVVADHLVDATILDAHVDKSAELIVRPAKRVEMEQDEITRILIARAREGKIVVRLKGGDPFVFGRGGEEAQALFAASIPFEVVPGVPAAVAVPAYAGIPVTHRGAAASVAFATGHEADLKEGGQVAWDALSRGASTLVLYMSLAKLSDTVARLRAAGRPAGEPVAIIERGTTPRQRTLISTLGEVVAAAKAMNLEPPALTIVGEVVRSGRVPWFETRRLHGRRLVVVASKPPRTTLRRHDGLEVTWCNPFAIVPHPPVVKEALSALPPVRALALVSTHAVDVLISSLRTLGHDVRVLAGIKLAAVGEATAARLTRSGLSADLVGQEGGEALATEITNAAWQGPIAVLGAKESRPELADRLVQTGYDVRRIAAYQTIVDREALTLRHPFDAIAFSSPRGVRAYFEVNGAPANALIGAIGNTTARALADLGCPARVIAAAPDLETLVDEIAAAM